MAPYFTDIFGNPHSSDHSFGWEAAQAGEQAAARVAQLIGSDADEIIFTSGATEANNLALLGLARRAAGGRRRRILVSAIEHKSVLAVSHILREHLGFQIEVLPVDGAGRLTLSTLEEVLDEDVFLVSVMSVNNEIGTIQDVAKISGAIRNSGAIFHCDSAQTPCAMELNEFAEYTDLLSLSGHKMYGPKGVGALFIRRDLQNLIEPLIYGGAQQSNLRPGTLPIALCVGMGVAAVLLNSDEFREERRRLQACRDRFIRQLMNLAWPIFLNGPEFDRHPGNANIRFGGFSAHDILGALQPHVAASIGSACTSGLSAPSHVLRAIGLTGQEADESIRFSLGRGTTDADLDEVVGLIDETLSKLADAI